VYKNFWGDDNYADTYAMAALDGTGVMAGKSDVLRGEIVKKGIAYQAVWMYVLHEFEDAVDDCLSGNIFDNDAHNAAGDSPHAWDEGWAFYAGSLEGADGSGSGQMIHTLAEKRCKDFGTCASGITGAAKVNTKALADTELGRDKILASDCYGADVQFHKIVDQMTVPLIQGMLKYAFKSDPANAQGSCPTGVCDKAWAEGWAFAAAVLPRLHFCSKAVAEHVKANLDTNATAPMKDGFALLKTHVESTYPCLGITCADVGAFQTSAGVYTGMDACTDPTPTTETVTDTDGYMSGVTFAMIAGYLPATNVVPHAKVDLDMKEISDAVASSNSFNFAQAKFVYQNGGGGLCTQADIDAGGAGNPCTGQTTNDAKGNSVKGSGAIRTLQGFATSGAAKMSTEKWWNVYKNYWGDDNYADTYAMAALDGTGVMAGKSNVLRAELVKKGIAYQTVWMYVLHEFEDAIMDCLAGDLFNNDASSSAGDSPHAWDEGWAFYAGSLEGTDGAGKGQMIHQLAEKRCADFGTCCDGTTGPAKANGRALQKARKGRNKILSGDCFTVAKDFDAIVDQMTVPLIQGMLKYAFKADPANSLGSCGDGTCDKEWAEGWAFAAAVLPRLHYCSYEVADLVRGNLDTASAAPMKDGFALLKTHVESTYPCLGITCADVGAFQTSAGVYAGAEACTDTVIITGGEADEDDGCPTATSTDAPATAGPTSAAPTTADTTAAPTKAATAAPAATDEPKTAVVDSYAFAALSVFVVGLNA
jgi:hypothetical protein